MLGLLALRLQNVARSSGQRSHRLHTSVCIARLDGIKQIVAIAAVPGLGLEATTASAVFLKGVAVFVVADKSLQYHPSAVGGPILLVKDLDFKIDDFSPAKETAVRGLHDLHLGDGIAD